jgi:hypothetical protein
MGLVGRIGSRFARRSRWLAQRLWIVAAAEVALASRRHWRRLEPAERGRLIELVRKSKGRRGRLSDRERRELGDLLEKLGHAELAGSVVGTLLPFRPLGRIVEFGVGRISRRRGPEAAEA